MTITGRLQADGIIDTRHTVRQVHSQINKACSGDTLWFMANNVFISINSTHIGALDGLCNLERSAFVEIGLVRMRVRVCGSICIGVSASMCVCM